MLVIKGRIIDNEEAQWSAYERKVRKTNYNKAKREGLEVAYTTERLDKLKLKNSIDIHRHYDTNRGKGELYVSAIWTFKPSLWTIPITVNLAQYITKKRQSQLSCS